MSQKTILIVVLIVIVGGGAYAISQIFSRPSQPTAVASPLVPAGMGQADGAGDSIPVSKKQEKGTGTPSDKPRLTTDDIDRQMQKNLAEHFSKPAASGNPPPKRPDSVNVQ
jgi:hypothetical protein